MFGECYRYNYEKNEVPLVPHLQARAVAKSEPPARGLPTRETNPARSYGLFNIVLYLITS